VVVVEWVVLERREVLAVREVVKTEWEVPEVRAVW
jgi:hypothetical protein